MLVNITLEINKLKTGTAKAILGAVYPLGTTL
jgi:hypothetical protein